MRGVLLAIGLALVGFGLTILFGAPQRLIADYEFWPETGVAVLVGGVLLVAVSAASLLRRGNREATAEGAARTVSIAELDARIAKLLSDVQIREQWRSNATEYGDDTRAHALEAELLRLRAELAEANTRVQALGRRSTPGLRLTATRSENRLTFTNDVGAAVGVGEVVGEGDIDLTMRTKPPFVLPAGGSFFVNLHFIPGRTEKNPAVVVRWTGSDGEVRVQRIGV